MFHNDNNHDDDDDDDQLNQQQQIASHRKLTRVFAQNPIVEDSTNQSVPRYETHIVLDAHNQDVYVSLHQPKSTINEFQSYSNSNHHMNGSKPYIFSRQAYRDIPPPPFNHHHSDYYSHNLFTTFFGYNTGRWFNGIIGCLKPFFDLLGTKDSQMMQGFHHHQDDDWEIPFEMIKDLQWLGSGAQGAVFMGKYNNEWVAVKKVKEKRETEIRHLRKLNHSNIVAFRGVCTQSPNCYCIVMEFCPYGQLYEFLKSGQQLSPSMILEWARQIASGMNYLHSYKIIHRDLKSPNVLISYNDTLKISDFGTCKQWNDRSTKMSFTGTVAWMAPEIIRDELCSEKVDIWSYGVVLWELLNCEIPYRDVDSSAIIWGVGNSSLTLPIPSGLPRGFDLLLQQCWNVKPRNRPSFRQILMHLDIANTELASIEANQFFIIQQQWRDEIRNCMRRMKRRRSSVAISNERQMMNENYKDEIEHLICKRKEELMHAQHIREEYVRKRECANNLYMELMTCLLKLEQREKNLLQREHSLMTRMAKQCGQQQLQLQQSLSDRSPLSILSPFVEKVPEVFQQELYDCNKVIPYTLLDYNDHDKQRNRIEPATITIDDDNDESGNENLNFIVSPSPPPSNSRKINHRKKRISINNSPKRMKSPNYYRRSPKKSSTCHQCHHHSSIKNHRYRHHNHHSSSPIITSPNHHNIVKNAQSNNEETMNPETTTDNVLLRNSNTPSRPSILDKNFNKIHHHSLTKMKHSDKAIQTTNDCNNVFNYHYNSDNSNSSPSIDHRFATTIDKSSSTTTTILLESSSNPNSPNNNNNQHSKLIPKMSTTSTFDSGYGGDGYQSCLSTPSTHSNKIRFPDKSPMTPSSIKSPFGDGEFADLDDNNVKAATTSASTSTTTTTFNRIKCRQSNSNTLPSLSSIDENSVNEELEKNDLFIINNRNNREPRIIEESIEEVNKVIFETFEQQQNRKSRKIMGNKFNRKHYSDNDSSSSSSSNQSYLHSDSDGDSCNCSDDDDDGDDDEDAVDDDDSKYLLRKKFHKAVHQFNESSRRYCDSISSSTSSDNNDDISDQEEEAIGKNTTLSMNIIHNQHCQKQKKQQQNQNQQTLANIDN
nr:serine/threonine-protein kinase phg2-like isoform X2 [Dermatophagoides farinae]